MLKYVKYLPQYGWQPVVLTVRDGDFPARDESLLKEVPENTEVFRTKIFEPYTLYRKLLGMKKNAYIDVENIPGSAGNKSIKSRLAEFVRANIFIPDARIGWRKHAVKKGLEIINQNKIDLLYSSSPPYTCSLIARDLKRKSGLKWVAGFRDPWTGFLNTPKRKGIAKNIDLKYEYTCYSEADRIEVAWPGIKEDITGKYSGINTDKIFYVPNGYDPEDFTQPVFREQKEDKFTITYSGSMYGLRNPGSFLTAMDKLYEEGKITPGEVKLNFIGRFGAEASSSDFRPFLGRCSRMRSHRSR